MEIMIGKEKDKKKGSKKKSWWFFPRSKASEPGTVHVTLPYSPSSQNGSREKATNANGDGSRIGFHDNQVGEGLRKKISKDEDADLLETRLDMETFTNNLWIEFENELKGVWPGNSTPSGGGGAGGGSSGMRTAAPTATLPVGQPSPSFDSNHRRRHDNGKINGEKGEMISHVVIGKPPLPSVPSSSMAASSGNATVPVPAHRTKTSKLTKKSSVGGEAEARTERVNDPVPVFDKFRQIAREGCERVAKSVRHLNGVDGCEKIKGENGASDDVGAEGKWRESNQNLVGYLETDIDTFHSREVIRVNQPVDVSPIARLSSRRENGSATPTTHFGSNVKRHKPVKLKTQSMFNLIDGADGSPNPLPRNLSPKPEIDTAAVDDPAEDMSAASRAKSVEYLLKMENQAATMAPENRLMRLRVNGAQSQAPEVVSPAYSEYENRIRRSLQKLELPQWYTNSRVGQNGSIEHVRRDSEERQSLRWADFRNRSTSSSSIYSINSAGKSRNAVVINKRVTTPDWRNVRSSRESLVHTPSSPTSSTQMEDNGYGFGMSRWGSSRFSTNSSRSSSPTSSHHHVSGGGYRMKHQPYLGWRSSEKLAAINAQNAPGKPQTPSFYRSAAERLSKGPGYYAMRFGVYSRNNSFNHTEPDVTIV